MEFTEFLIDEETMNKRLEEARKNLKRTQNEDNLLSYGASVIQQRLLDDPLNYRAFGPWWPALKNILAKHSMLGYSENGADQWPEVFKKYNFDMPEKVLLAADDFYRFSRTHYFHGNADFMLDANSGETWHLFDEELESDLPPYHPDYVPEWARD